MTLDIVTKSIPFLHMAKGKLEILRFDRKWISQSATSFFVSLCVRHFVNSSTRD